MRRISAYLFVGDFFMPRGVQSGLFTDRAEETIEAVLHYYFTVTATSAEFIAKQIIRCLENDLKAGLCHPLSAWVWNTKSEQKAGLPGTPILHSPTVAAVQSPQPAAAVAAGVPRGTCPKCKKPYENCSCSFGLPNGK